MENKGIYFTALQLQNIRCFGKEAILKLSSNNNKWGKWNVILGDNGTGKTTLLQCLAELEQVISTDFQTDDNKPQWNCLGYHKSKLSHRQKSDIKSFTIHIEGSLIDVADRSRENVSFFQEGGLSGSTILFDKTAKFANIFIIGYGANRRISFQILSEKETELNKSATLFDDDAKLINAEEWLYQLDYAASRESELKPLAIQRRNLIIDALKNILPDVDDIHFKDSVNIEKPVPRLEFKTPYGWVGIRELSYGYKTMVAWIVDVAAQMFKRYPDSDNPLEEPVIILVDEIDLHLHPKWQRQIFDFLNDRFPRAQFIVTAHSPLIVQSAPADANIIVLRKEQDENGENVVVIDNNIQSVRTWRIDQIMSSDRIFGINSSRSPEIEKLMEERSSLLKRKDLSPAEKVRLEELNDLSYSLPTADNDEDIEAMQIIRDAAAFLKKKQKENDTDKQ